MDSEQQRCWRLYRRRAGSARLPRESPALWVGQRPHTPRQCLGMLHLQGEGAPTASASAYASTHAGILHTHRAREEMWPELLGCRRGSTRHDSLLLSHTHSDSATTHTHMDPESDHLRKYRTTSTRDLCVLVCMCEICILCDDNNSDKFQRHTQNCVYSSVYLCSQGVYGYCEVCTGVCVL